MDDNTSNISKFNAIQFFEAQQEYSERISQINCTKNDELATIKEKYKDLLEEYDKEQIAMQGLLNGFNAFWELQLSDYQNEVDALEKDYINVLDIISKPALLDFIDL